MADATRQRTIYQIQQILKAYKAKLEKASTYRDFLSAEGKSLTDDYMEKNSETKSLIEKAVSDPSFFLNMENDNLIRYSDVCIKLNKLLKLKVQDVERIKKIVNTNFFITSDAQRITSFAEVELGRIVTYNVGEAERIDANNILNKGLYDVEWEVEDVGGNFDEATAKKEKRIFKLVNTMKNAATDWPIISLISDANPFEIQLKAVKLGEYKIRAKIYNDTGLTKTLYDVIEFEQFVNDVDEKIASLSTFEKLKKALEMVKWKREIDIGALAKSLWNSIPMILFIAALIISCGEIASAILILMSLADGCRNINDGFTKVAQGFETVKNAGSEDALRHGGELIHEGLIIFGLGTIEVFLSKCTMKNVHTARIQLLKGETKAIVQSGTKALPSAAMKEIASSTSTAVPALTEIQISETMAESAKKTSLVLADVSVKSEEKKLLDEVVKDAEIINERSGKKGDWNKVLNTDLEPNTIYKVDSYNYHTDKFGRVDNVKGKLEFQTKGRNTYQQGKSVELKEGIKGVDDGGHIIAQIFNGPGEQINYVPQTQTLNRGDWKAMENEWKKALEKGKKIEVDIKINYNSTRRPTDFEVIYYIDGIRNKKLFLNE
nr:DNA/RNA non-specific endonuclease [uncultured Treponema sp.]